MSGCASLALEALQVTGSFKVRGALMAIGHSPGRLLIDLVPIATGAAICAIVLVSTKPPDAAPEPLPARPR